MTDFVSKLPRVLCLILLIWLISLNYSRVKDEPQKEQINIPTGLISKYFSGYTELIRESEVLYIVNDRDGELGRLIVTTPLADNIIGFGGNVPVVLFAKPDNRIVGLELLDNYESPDFIEQIAATGFFDSWNGKSLQEAAVLDVDGVSGASMTTDAVKAGIKKALVYHLNLEKKTVSMDGLMILRLILGWSVVMLATVSMFAGGRLKKIRVLLLVASVLIVGVWSGYFVSFALLFGWLLNGIPWQGRLLLIVITGLSFLFPLFLGKAYYCSYLCPYGAAQELVGKLRKKKWVLKGKMRQICRYTRWVYFVCVMGILLYGASVDLTLFEPFSAFMFQSAGRWMITLSLVFLFLSVFLARPWCNYFCLTGHFLELLRQGKGSGNTRRVVIEWLMLVFLIVVLLFIIL